jgi:hypothetical protein
MRRLVLYVGIGIIISGFAWTAITFVGESVHETKDPDNTNETIIEEVPRLMLRSWYPWNALSGGGYVVSFVIQVKIIIIIATTITITNCSVIQSIVKVESYFPPGRVAVTLCPKYRSHLFVIPSDLELY